MPPITANSSNSSNANRWEQGISHSEYTPSVEDRLDSIQKRLESIGTKIEPSPMRRIETTALSEMRISREDFLSRFLAKEISEDLLSPFGGARETARIVAGIFTLDAARHRVSTALSEDNARADSELSLTKQVIKDEVSRTLSEAIAASLIKNGLKRNPSAAAVAAVIGPEPIDALLDDGVRIAEWGLSSISRDGNGELVFDPDALIENVPDLKYGKKMGQAGSEFGTELRKAGFLEKSYEFLDNLGERTSDFFRGIFK